jgi:hypothetical protein
MNGKEKGGCRRATAIKKEPILAGSLPCRAGDASRIDVADPARRAALIFALRTGIALVSAFAHLFWAAAALQAKWETQLANLLEDNP